MIDTECKVCGSCKYCTIIIFFASEIHEKRVHEDKEEYFSRSKVPITDLVDVDRKEFSSDGIDAFALLKGIKEAVFWANVRDESVLKLMEVYRLDFILFGYDKRQYLVRKKFELEEHFRENGWPLE